MPPLDDAEIARRLLHHLARAFGCADAVYVAGPARIQGGFDTTIFGFTLDRAAPELAGPLILRLSHASADPARVKLETVVQNTLADMGYPAPRVMVTESDPSLLGGPFMVMARVPGKPLGHAIEGFGAGSSFARRLQLLLRLPAILSGIIAQWVEVQISLHQLPADRLLQAVTAAGIDRASRRRARSAFVGLRDLHADAAARADRRDLAHHVRSRREPRAVARARGRRS